MKTNRDLDQHLSAIVRPKGLSDQVAELLLEKIIEGGLQPGDRLPSERHLSKRLNVARTVVREAIRDLRVRGIVSVHPGLGVLVAPLADLEPGASEVADPGMEHVSYDDIQEVRRALEVEIAQLAARRATDEGVERIRQALAEQEAAEGDLERSALADLEFHRALAAATENPLFLIILDSFREMGLELRRTSMQVPGALRVGIDAHGRIADAVAARDPVAARREMARHFALARREYFGTQRRRLARQSAGRVVKGSADDLATMPMSAASSTV